MPDTPDLSSAELSSGGPSAASLPPKATLAVKAPSSLLPDLPKETWEYLELKLWNSFSKKIWFSVGGLATILGLVATLGLNSWIQSKIDAALSAEKAKLDSLNSDQQAKSETALVLSAIAFHIRLREIRDIDNYEALVFDFKRQFGEEATKAVLASAEVSDLLWPLKPYGGFGTITDDAIKKTVVAVGKSTNSTDLSKVKEALVNLRNASVHVLALKDMGKSAETLLFSKIQADPNRLVKLYEEELLPVYMKRLASGSSSRVWVSSRERSVNSLFPSGQSEFSFYVPSYMDKLFSSDNEKK